MSSKFCSISGLLLAFCAREPRAQDVPAALPRLVLDTGRMPVSPAEPGLVRFQIHGEEQLRLEGLRSFPLDPTESTVLANPRTVGDSIGQNVFLSHWLRLTPTLQITRSEERRVGEEG